MRRWRLRRWLAALGFHPLGGHDRGGQHPGLRPTSRIGDFRYPHPPHVRWLTGAAEEHCSGGHDVVAPHSGDLVRVRRAAEVLQQGCIEHVTDLRIATADDLGETACDEAAVERLL